MAIEHLSEEGAVQLLEQLGAVQQGHIIGTSGAHLDAYVAKDVPTRYPGRLRDLIGGIAYIVTGASELDVDVVVAAPMGALLGGGQLAEELDAEYAFLEEVGDEEDGGKKLAVKRQVFIDAVRGRRVGIFEDIVNTRKTAAKSIAAVRAVEGEVAWVSCLWNRGGAAAADLDVPFLLPLVDRKLSKWDTYELCRADGPCSRQEPVRTDLGHPGKFFAIDPNYPGGFEPPLA